MLLGNRYYASGIGRFLSEDPSGDGDNWYAYCGNDPLGGIDPTGLEDISWPGWGGNDGTQNAPQDDGHRQDGDTTTDPYGTTWTYGQSWAYNSGTSGPTTAYSGWGIACTDGSDGTDAPPPSSQEDASGSILNDSDAEAANAVANGETSVVTAAVSMIGGEGEALVSAGGKLPDFSGKSIGTVEKVLADNKFAERPKAPGNSPRYRTFDHDDGSKVSIDTEERVVKVNGPKNIPKDPMRPHNSGLYRRRYLPHNQPYID